MSTRQVSAHKKNGGINYLMYDIYEGPRVKWKEGKKKHGDTFTDDPLEELYEELLDALNYADYAQQDGRMLAREHQLITDGLRSIQKAVYSMYHERKGRIG